VRFGGRLEFFSRGNRWVISRGLGPADDVRAHSRSFAASMVDDWCNDVMTWPVMLELYEELMGASHRPPTSTDLEEWIKPRLRRAFEDGTFVATEVSLFEQTTRAKDEGVHGQATKIEPPLPPPPPRRPVALPKTLFSFAVRFVDELGSAISGVELTFVHGGAKDNGTTDGNGVARLEDSPVRTASVKVVDSKALRKALKPQWDQVRGGRKWLDETQGVTVARLMGDNLPSFDLVADKLRIVSVQPYVARARLIGGFFDTNKTFILPVGLDGIRGIVRMYAELPRSKMLIVGHTDTAGKPSYNDVLSLERAESLKDYLTDNVDGWLKWYADGVSEAKRWGTIEDRKMIATLPDASSREKTETPVRWFQRTRGLTVDGNAGPETRKTLIKEYMALDGTSLPGGIEVVAHGCGENFPRDATGDEVEDPDNRRTEVYFFDEVLGIQPPPSGKNSAKGSPEYPEWVRRSQRTDDFGGKDTFDIRLVSADGHPIPEATYVIQFADGSSRGGTLNGDGHATIDGAPEGPFTVEYPDQVDVRAKALAARIHAAMAARDTEVILGVLSQPADELGRVSDAYDRYFNDLTGQGLAEDAHAALGETEDGKCADHLIAAAGMPPHSGAIVVAYAETDVTRGSAATGAAVA
jgi:outer membrane protein OmpA-like peptidoglycan-associated protein